jgi:hypothetical protein
MWALADRAKALPPRTLAMLWVQALVLPLLKHREPEEALGSAERAIEINLQAREILGMEP